MDRDDTKLDELDKLLNDPEVPMQASRIWELLAEISEKPEPKSYSWPVALPAYGGLTSGARVSRRNV